MSEIKVNSIKGVGASVAALSINNTDGTCTANITNNLSNRRINVNGAMIDSQRGSSFAAVANDAYTLDRYKHKVGNSSAAFTVTKSTTTPDGFSNSLKYHLYLILKYQCYQLVLSTLVFYLTFPIPQLMFDQHSFA